MRLLLAYLGLVARTTRWRLLDPEHAAPLLAGRGVILAFWHEHLAVFAACWRLALARATGGDVPPVSILISRHRDGRLIAEVLARSGAGIVEGSSTRGALEGLRGMLRALRTGRVLVITPDGPRGPWRQAAPGVAQIAAASGAVVLPCAAMTTRHRLLGSWDRLVLPLPFGRGVIALGPGIAVPREGAAEALPRIGAALTAARLRAEAALPA